MKILIDIGHPGHVHLFKNFAHVFSEQGHKVIFTVREKEHEIELLNFEKLPFVRTGRHYSSIFGKIAGFIIINLRILFISFRFKPDLFLSHGSVYTLLSAFMLRKPNIALEDTGNSEQVRLYLPFTRAVLTSQAFLSGMAQSRYSTMVIMSWHICIRIILVLILLFYKELGLTEGEKYFIVRFVAWQASHDRNNSGLSNQEKQK